MTDAAGHSRRPEAAGSGASRFLLRLARRARSTRPSTLLFYLAGWIAIMLWALPALIDLTSSTGFLNCVRVEILPIALTAMTLFLAQQLSTDTAGELIDRPGKFILVMSTGTLLIYPVIGIYDTAMHTGMYAWLIEHRIFPGWFRFGLFFGALGWLSLQYQRRDEDRARFATLFIHHSILARDVAQSRLLATRAQISPHLVVQILNKVHALYQYDSRAASELTDQLIAYLRLAMNRMRERKLPLSSEMEMARSYIALRAAESGRRVDFGIERSSLSEPEKSAAEPVFLVAQKLIDAALDDGADELSFRLALNEERLTISLRRKCRIFDEASLRQLKMELDVISRHAADSLCHDRDDDMHAYRITLRA